jgi:hypothetical protein
MIKQVTLDRANRKKDKSVSLTFITELEQSSSEFMEIDSNLDKHGVIYFKTNGKLTEEEVEQIDKVDIQAEGKTKSQRLRNVLFIYNQQNGDKDFKEFYADEMEKVIEHYKGKLK